MTQRRELLPAHLLWAMPLISDPSGCLFCVPLGPLSHSIPRLFSSARIIIGLPGKLSGPLCPPSTAQLPFLAPASPAAPSCTVARFLPLPCQSPASPHHFLLPLPSQCPVIIPGDLAQVPPLLGLLMIPRLSEEPFRGILRPAKGGLGHVRRLGGQLRAQNARGGQKTFAEQNLVALL